MDESNTGAAPTASQQHEAGGPVEVGADQAAEQADDHATPRQRPLPLPGTDQAKAELGRDLKMALLRQREVEEQGKDDFKVTNLVWAHRLGRTSANDIVQVTGGHRWPTPDRLHAWDRESHFEKLLVMRGQWLHYGVWPSADQLAAWDDANHDPFLVGWRRQWFPGSLPPQSVVPPAPAMPPPQSDLAVVKPDAVHLAEHADLQSGILHHHRSLDVAVVAVVAVVVVAGVLAAAVVPRLRDRLRPKPPAPAAVSVTTPSEGEDVCYRHTVIGTATHLRDDQQLWLVVRPALDSRVYPQPGGPMVVSSKHRWSREAFFGVGPNRAGGEDETFVLDVIGASPDANDSLGAYMTNGYPAGMVKYPSGSRILASVQVRRAAC